jgi:energy-coupling factor transporter ATP-binding protein EcfA2
MPLSQKARALLDRWGSAPPPSAIELRNFKAFGAEGSGKIPLKPITLIFGQNSAGKSSLLHSLLWLDHGVTTGEWDVHHPRLAGDLVDLGGFSRFVHRHEGERTISVSLDLESRIGTVQLTLGFGKVAADDEAEETEEEELGLGLRPEPRRFDREARRFGISRPEDVIGLRSYEISCEGQVVLRFIRRRGELILDVLAINSRLLTTILRERRQNDLFATIEDKDVEDATNDLMSRIPTKTRASSLLSQGLMSYLSFRMRSERGNVRQNPIEEKLFQAISILTRDVSRHLSGMGSRDLIGTAYIGPLRVYPDRDLAMVTETDRSDWLASGLFAWEILRELPEARERVNRVITDILKLGYEFRMAHRSLTPEEASRVADEEIARGLTDYSGNEEGGPIDDHISYLSDVISKALQLAATENQSGFLRLIDSKTGTPLAAKDVGMGISQVIPILVAASVLDHKTICMEQPELHLHPGLQAKLADALITSALQQRNTLLIETHSEHLILRILRRIRETTEGEIADWPEALRRACPNGIRPEDVAVLYVESGEDGAKVIELPVTSDGDFSKPWPGGFFAERSKELF